jgi:hypothetical protein
VIHHYQYLKKKNEFNIFGPQSSEINFNKSLYIGDFFTQNLTLMIWSKRQIIENHWRPINSNGYPFSNHKKCGYIEKIFVKKSI